MKKLFILCFFMLACCGTPQNPTTKQPTYQIVDNSQVTIVVGDNNSTKPTSESKTTNEPTATQETESVTKSSAWIVWLVILGVLTGVGILVYLRYFKKR